MGCRSPPGWRACKSSQLLRAFKAQRVSWEGASAGCWLCTAFCQASGDSTSCSPACGGLAVGGVGGWQATMDLKSKQHPMGKFKFSTGSACHRCPQHRLAETVLQSVGEPSSSEA